VDKRVHGTGKLQKVSSAWSELGGTVSRTSTSLHSLSSFTLVAHFQTLPNVEMQVQLF